MATLEEKHKQELELGFGSKNYKTDVRFLNRDGSVNVKRAGLGSLNNFDMYHWLITATNWQLTLLIITRYIMINIIFALAYYCVGTENFGGLDGNSEFQKLTGLFFFSAQTITTLGYGHIYPINNSASIVAAIESLLGLLSFAIATGVLYGRFSRPRADILYSKNVLLAPYKTITGLMLRIANKKQYELIESEANVTMTMKNPSTNRREFYQLSLEINRINFLAFSWTIVHPIDEKSPIYGLSRQELEERDIEILVLIKAINDTYSQTVYSRYSYKWADFVEQAKFKPLKQEANKYGKLEIKVADIHHFDKII